MSTAHRSVAMHWIDGKWVDSAEHRNSVDPATGKEIMAAASADLKRVGLELGGKTPLILFEDADLEQALPIVVSALIVFSGQFRMTGSRLLVHERIAERVRTGLAARLEAVRVALALESGSVWVNDWARLHDQFEEGGFKASGLGRMRGFAVLDDFIEYKHIRLQPGSTLAASLT